MTSSRRAPHPRAAARGIDTDAPSPPGLAVRERSPIGRLLRGPGGPALVLRAFLGVTFTFAGLQKLANPDFFRAAAPGSFEAQLRGSIQTSPLHHLLSPLLHVATPVAVVISLGEVAVGVGTLLGLFGRIAAIGGALLSLSFFLTVSFNDSPYYYGADIVFLFAWTPFMIAGSGVPSLDDLLARRTSASAAESVTPHGEPSAVPRSTELDRRTFLGRATAAGAVGIGALALGGLVAALGRMRRASPTPSGTAALSQGTVPATTPRPGTTSTTAAGGTTARRQLPSGTRIGPASEVPIGGAASFTDAALGVPAFVVHPSKDTFRAFSAVCPHAGCQVGFDHNLEVFACPCHGSVFNGATGAVEQGPATRGLTPIPITLASNAELYVDTD